MQALKFELSGETAFFKKPDVNSYIYFTYGNIHKIALLGILGSILGLDGYVFQQDKMFPDFYSKLSDIKVCIVPQNKEGYIHKKVQTFNNSVGYASQELGGNLIIMEQWLEKPKWDIYIQINKNGYIKELKDRLLEKRYKYIPYLGKNDHFASINNTELVQLEKVSGSSSVDSLFIKEYFEITASSVVLLNSILNKLSGGNADVHHEKWKYEERLPVSLEEKTNQYEFKNFVFTNMRVDIKEEIDLYGHNGKVLFFF